MEAIKKLILKHLQERLSPQEEAELNAWLDKSPHFKRIFNEINNSQSLSESFAKLDSLNQEKVWKRLKAVTTSDQVFQRPVHRIHFLKTAWFRYAAAVVLIAGGAIAYVISSDSEKSPSIATNKSLSTDIAPGSNKAVLTLADGTKVILDNAANGNLAQQGSAQVVKLANGQIVYNVKGLSDKDIMWNTMSTPAGGQYRVTLPDGSKVWLNAASSITYPAVFAGKDREVKVTGEVYFEVAKNTQKPFIVDIDGKANVHVLGTSFNVNSYNNEENIKTTLLEGSVKVIKANQSAVLKPGQQAVQSKDESIFVQSADMEQTLAWKNGLFSFNDSDLRSVMRQLERWYDIKVRYEGQASDITLKGKMYRNVNLSVVLEFLQRMGVNTRMDGKTLIVL